MKKSIRELEKIAYELRRAKDQMAAEVRDGGRQSQKGFERVMRAVHQMHNFLFTVPEKLMKIAEDLKQ